MGIDMTGNSSFCVEDEDDADETLNQMIRTL